MIPKATLNRCTDIVHSLTADALGQSRVFIQTLSDLGATEYGPDSIALPERLRAVLPFCYFNSAIVQRSVVSSSDQPLGSFISAVREMFIFSAAGALSSPDTRLPHPALHNFVSVKFERLDSDLPEFLRNTWDDFREDVYQATTVFVLGAALEDLGVSDVTISDLAPSVTSLRAAASRLSAASADLLSIATRPPRSFLSSLFGR